jgi:hypothetical protein
LITTATLLRAKTDCYEAAAATDSRYVAAVVSNGPVAATYHGMIDVILLLKNNVII